MPSAADRPPVDDEDLLSIGRFAEACRLTVTTLRHYDDIGLLPPAWVDPHTSYRYYRRSQVPRAITIGALRSLGLGLPTIKEIIEGPEGAASALAAEHERAVGELRRRERAVATIRRLSELGELPSYEVGLAHRESVAVHALSLVARSEDLVDRTTSTLAMLVAAVEEAGRRWTDPIGSILETAADADEVRLRVVIAAADFATPIEGLDADELPGGTFVTATHVGPYELAGFAHDAVRGWADASGLRPVGPICELYVNDPAVTAPGSLVTEVMLPVESSGSGEGT